MFKFPQPSEEEKASPASVSPTRTATDAQGALAEHMPCPGLVTVLHHEQELDRILETLGSRWVVLELLASWSAACAAIRSDFEVLAKAYPTWIFLRADILQLPGLARRWSCTRVPLYVFFWQGAQETQFAGASVRKLREVLDDCSMLGPTDIAAHADPAGRVTDWKLGESRGSSAAGASEESDREG
ncbi:TPR repeat-containing thioredoxin TDX (OsTrx26) (Tetratricoredoxin) (OsTDX) [Durusdinium trenchii]|uniref:TPR repeat-containing thioredoxin TDX (OsTrx26) (Tetratricoredoxin) (OsTDX) n=1 Tax=Durusdinium trenchii TaxID=1381693 RepID=A0ABP0LF37_9DINO